MQITNEDIRKEIDEEDEIEKNIEKLDDWLDTCPFKYTVVSHPSSDIISVNFEIIQE